VRKIDSNGPKISDEAGIQVFLSRERYFPSTPPAVLGY
jgi:hypothetical protein